MLLRTLGLAVSLVILSELGALAAVNDGAFANVEAGKVWYQTCGSGHKAMILVHDGVLHSATWDDVWPTLCKSFHVLRYDRRGFGRSPAATASYSPLDDLSAVMHAAGMSHAVIVGSSAGGGIALDFALAKPSAVDRLILVGPQVSGLAQSQYFVERTVALLDRLKKGDIEGGLKNHGWLFGPGHDSAREKVAAELTANPQDLRWISHPDPARSAPDARPLLPKIKVPCLILVGAYDSPDVQAWAGVLEALIPNAERIVVPDTGHLMYLEHPAIFSDIVLRSSDARQHSDREESVRRFVQSLESGKPNYAEMSEPLAETVRIELPRLSKLMKRLGAFRSINYVRSTPDGDDVYRVVFENGKTEWTIGPLTADGKVQTRDFNLI